MADQSIPQESEKEEDARIEYEARIADRVLDWIAPDELPDDVDPIGVAYYALWLRLTGILFTCNFTADELISDVRSEQLDQSEPEGSA